MKKVASYAVFIMVLGLLVISGIGCHLIFGFSPSNVQPSNSYSCNGTIYRVLAGGEEFTEEYQTDIWPNAGIDASALCSQKIDEYINAYLAPGFPWQKRDISVYQNPLNMNGADCDLTEPYSQSFSPLYGGPWGSTISWEDPVPAGQAYLSIRMYKDGTDHYAEPKVEHALVRLAERTGLPNDSGIYVRGVRHVRIEHMSIELKPFSIAGLNVNEFRIHNIGAVNTDSYGTSATIEPETLKLYLYASGANEDGSGTTSQCILNDRGTGIGYVIYPYPYFFFTLDTQLNIGGIPVWVHISLISPSGKKFNVHQPYVSLLTPSNWWGFSPVTLTPFSYHDGDSYDAKPDRVLWFENFEASNEIFLGEGMTLSNVSLAPGLHEITVVVYDSWGAYNTATSTLNVLPPLHPIILGVDYVTTAVAHLQEVVAPGGKISVGGIVENHGAWAATKSSYTRFYLSKNTARDSTDKLLTPSRVVPPLPGGGTDIGVVTSTIPTTTPTGNYYIIACADDTKVITEYDETNNCRASDTTVQVALPDYIEFYVFDPPQAVAPGDKFWVLDVTINQGIAGATKSSYTRYYLSLDGTKSTTDKILTGNRLVPALGAGGFSWGIVSVTVPSSMPLENYYLLACADDTKSVPETDENNNCFASFGRVTVTRPDYFVTSLSDPPASVSPGGNFIVTDTVQNQGIVGSAKSTYMRYYLSLDNLKTTADKLLTGSRVVPALDAGATSTASVTVTIPTTTLTGKEYYLFACADDTKQVVETIELNNCKISASKVFVGKAD
jgi:hypothetical protein